MFAAQKDDGKIKVDVVLRWTEATDEQIRSYVNGIRTHAGGTHESGLRTGIAKAVRNYMDVHNIKQKGITITNDDIREGVIGILSTFHSNPMFQGQTKEKLNNPDMNTAVEGLLRPSLESWLNHNPTIADAVVGRIVLAARAREASRAAAGEVRRKSPGSRKNNLPGKLVDCRLNDPSKTELFIVEGDSAGGTAVLGRDSKTQAVLPLRGKILNTESLSITKILGNQEIRSLVETLGTGIGPDFDIRRLRYGRPFLARNSGNACSTPYPRTLSVVKERSLSHIWRRPAPMSCSSSSLTPATDSCRFLAMALAISMVLARSRSDGTKWLSSPMR